ncbi:cysteine desulfurase [Candidatus Micrarchaeota archaeon]|nr:cysteine desulfurase [Candidatus Micrarchaeota archaeon]
MAVFSSLFSVPSGPAYFDSAASSLTCKAALEAMASYYSQDRANVHRGAHRYTRQASERYEAVYGKLASFFNATDQEFAAVRNSTEALNAVALGLDWKSGDEVVVTDVEHHSNLLPWLRLQKQGVKIRVLAADGQGRFQADDLSELLSRKTRLVSFTACSNVLGASVPVVDLAKAAQDAGALVCVDAAQYVGHHAVDLKKWPVDFLAFSGHKCFGPTGIGALFHREGSGLQPWFVGGGTVRDVTLKDYQLLEHREQFEAGTPAIAEWIGLGAALDVVSKIGCAAIEEHDRGLAEKMLSILQETDDVQVFGPTSAAEKSCALFAFSVKNVPHHQAAVMLDELGFAVRSGHHCAIPLTRKLAVEGTVRASLHAYNNEKQVEAFGNALEQVAQLA